MTARASPHVFFRFALIMQALVACVPSRALAEAGSFLHAPPFSSDRIDRLPPEVQQSIRHMCRVSPTAEQYFATYLDDGRIIKLHFERFRCEGQPAYRDAGRCLHEQFVHAGSHYRLLKTYFERCDD